MKTNRFAVLAVALLLSASLIACTPSAGVETPAQPPVSQVTPLTTQPPAVETSAPPATQPTEPAQTPVPSTAQEHSVSLTVRGTDAIYLAGRDDVVIPLLGAEAPDFVLQRCGGETLSLIRPLDRDATVTGGVAFHGGLTGCGFVLSYCDHAPESVAICSGRRHGFEYAPGADHRGSRGSGGDHGQSIATGWVQR